MIEFTLLPKEGMPMSRLPWDMTGKVVVITGGNSGIGLGFARGIAKAGGDVVIWGRRAEKNEAAAEEIRALGVRVCRRPSMSQTKPKWWSPWPRRSRKWAASTVS